MKLLLVMVVTVLLGVAGADAAGAQIVDANCPSFGNQAAAQARLRQDPSDPLALDSDVDGIACESLPAPQDLTPVPRNALVVTPTTVPATNLATTGKNLNVGAIGALFVALGAALVAAARPSFAAARPIGDILP